MDIIKHRTGSIGDVRNMYFPTGQFPDQPGIHRPKNKLSGFGFFPCPLDMIQNPFDFSGTEISVYDQSGLLPDKFGFPLSLQSITV